MENEKLLRRTLGFLVLIAGWVAYGLTVAPTVPFWDCGEFIAASASLGNPHPPGSPLFVLIGRIFTLLPIASDVSHRINLISVIASGFTGLMGYMIILKLFELWGGTSAGKFWKYLAAMSGALIMDFSNTFWSSAVEAEVYGFAMFLTLLLVYLALRWYEIRRAANFAASAGPDPASVHPDRYLVLIYYLGLLSVAVHMTVFLVMPLIFLFVLFADPAKRTDWRFWMAGGSLLIILAVLTPFLLAVAGSLVVSAAAYFGYGRKTASWRLALLLTLFGTLGFSAQLYIPIRSIQKPRIDENNPETWDRFNDFLERKQYGNENMITRAFSRRGKLSNQFGTYPRMGFWGFFEQQYGASGWGFAPLFLIGLAGLALPFRKDPKTAFLMASVVLAGTVGLVLYMNFADGTRMDAYGEAGLEVRDRDYFWTPGFIAFALAIGTGLGYLGRLLSEQNVRARLGDPLRRALAGGLVLLAVLIPTLELKANFLRNSRAGDYFPYDYAWDLLASCDRDGLLFTNGDNDTFPLWALQEAYGFRKDVRVINLSLLNTDWYILQLKHEMDVPISLADSQVATKYLPMPGMAQTFPRPEYPYYDRRRGVSHYLMPIQLDKQLLRVQDFMVEDIVLTNNFKYPLYFARTVPSSARVGLDANLVTEALVLRLQPEKKPDHYDREKSEKLLWQSYRYRNLDNPGVTYDDNAVGMMIVLPEMALELHDRLLQAGDSAKAAEQLALAVRHFPFYPRLASSLHDYCFARKDTAGARAALETCRKFLEETVRRASDNSVWWVFLSNIYQSEGRRADAYRAIERAWELNCSEDYIFRTYLQYAMGDNRADLLLKLANQWLENHPNDQLAQQILSQFGGISPPPQPRVLSQ